VFVALIFGAAENGARGGSGADAGAIAVAMVLATACAALAAAASVWRGTITGSIRVARA
jgi:hypothetical protein